MLYFLLVLNSIFHNYILFLIIKFAENLFDGVYVDNNIVEVKDFDRFYNLDEKKTGSFQNYIFVK